MGVGVQVPPPTLSKINKALGTTGFQPNVARGRTEMGCAADVAQVAKMRLILIMIGIACTTEGALPCDIGPEFRAILAGSPQDHRATAF